MWFHPIFLSSFLCLAKGHASFSFMFQPSFLLRSHSVWHFEMLQGNIPKRLWFFSGWFLVDLRSTDRHSQNIMDCWLKNCTVSFACVIVTQAVIFGVSCGLNPGAIPVRTQTWGGLTSNPGCQHFALRPLKGIGEGQPCFEPSGFFLSFGLCYSLPAVPALSFRVALRREQMSSKARIKLPDSFSMGENFNPDLERGQKSWRAGMLN